MKPKPELRDVFIVHDDRGFRDRKPKLKLVKAKASVREKTARMVDRIAACDYRRERTIGYHVFLTEADALTHFEEQLAEKEREVTALRVAFNKLQTG